MPWSSRHAIKFICISAPWACMSGDCKIEDKPGGGMLCWRHHRISLYPEQPKNMPGKLLKITIMESSMVKRIQGERKSTNFTERGRNKIGMVRRWGKKSCENFKSSDFNLIFVQHGDLGTLVCCTIGSYAKGTTRAAHLICSYSSNEGTCCLLQANRSSWVSLFCCLLSVWLPKIFQNFILALFKAFPTLHSPMYFWNSDYFFKLNPFGFIFSPYILSYFLVIARK